MLKKYKNTKVPFLSSVFLFIIILSPCFALASDVTENKYAVIIGIQKYKDPRIPPLNYAANDAKEFYEVLINSPGSDFLPENVLLLTDENADQVSIRSALGTWLARRAMADDTVIIFYAGHGAPEVDLTGRSIDGFSKYLVPYNADPTDLFATGIPMKEIEEIFQRIESKRLIFIADTCYSGATGGRSFSFGEKGRAMNISDKFLDNISQGEGRVVITSAGTNEVSLELDKYKHGLFTYHLLKGIRGEADSNNNGLITVSEVYKYVSENVSRHSRRIGGNQHPILKGSIKGEIVLARSFSLPGDSDSLSGEGGLIEINVDSPDVGIMIADKMVWISDDMNYQHMVKMAGGKYTIKARKNGYKEISRKVRVRDGGKTSIDFSFIPLKKEAYPLWRGITSKGLIISGGGLGLAGIGLFINAQLINQKEPQTESEYQAMQSEFDESIKWAAIAGGTALITTGIGLYLHFTSPRYSSKSNALIPHLVVDNKSTKIYFNIPF